MNRTGILFDKDNTLLDLSTFWRLPIHHLSCYLIYLLHTPRSNDLLEELDRAAGFSRGILIPESPVVCGTNFTVLEHQRAVLRHHGYDLSDLEMKQAVIELEQLCMEYGQAVSCHGEQLIPLLSALKEKQIILGIATSDDLNVTMHCLNLLGIAQYFDLVLCADTVQKPKPDPESAIRFMDMFHLSNDCTYMVGDSENDMRFASNSRIHGIRYDPDETLPDQPDTPVIHSLNQLLKLF